MMTITNPLFQLNSVSLPIVDPAVCRRQEVYGEDKISTGMFCAGLLQVDTADKYYIYQYRGGSHSAIICSGRRGHVPGRQRRPRRGLPAAAGQPRREGHAHGPRQLGVGPIYLSTYLLIYFYLLILF